MTQPTRLTFWRSALAITAVLPFLAIWDLLYLANDLDVDILSSKSWMGALSVLALGGFAALLTLISTRYRTRERTLSLLELPARFRWLGFFLVLLALTGYTIIFTLPFSRNFLGELSWVRFLIFWTFSLIGMYGHKGHKEKYLLVDITTRDCFIPDVGAFVGNPAFQYHFLSIFNGLVRNQPLLLPFIVFVRKDIWGSPARADPAS